VGNWRTVDIVGTIPASQLEQVRHFVNTGKDWGRFHCLSYYGPSLGGLNDWVRENVNVTGNLSERDYDVMDVAEVLGQIVEIAPGVELTVHCGGEWEDRICIASIVASKGEVTVHRFPPLRETVGDYYDEVMDLRARAMALGIGLS